MLNELKVLFRRNSMIKIVMAETLVITALSFFMFCGKDSVTFASVYDHNFMINEHTETISMIVILLIPLIGCLATGSMMPAGSGIRNQMVVLKGKKEYYRSKMITVFLVSFMNTLFIFELFHLYLLSSIDLSGHFYIAAEYSPIVPYDISTYNPMLLNHPYLFSHVLFLLLSLFAASCACLSHAVGQLTGVNLLYYIGAFAIIIPINLLFQFLKGNLTYNMGFSSFIQNLSGRPIYFSLINIFLWILIPVIVSAAMQVYIENRE